jgi:hypothetical protein
MAPIDDALAAIEVQGPEEKLVYQRIADQYGVDRSTLARRHKRVQVSQEVKQSSQQKLTPQQEAELVKDIEELTAHWIPPTREVIRTFALAVAKEPVSESWVTRFINKYTIDLVSLYSTGMNNDRHNADSYSKHKPYFDLLQAKIDGYNYMLGIPEVLQYAEVRGDITSISRGSIRYSTLLDTLPAERCKDWGTRGNQPTWRRTRYSDRQG